VPEKKWEKKNTMTFFNPNPKGLEKNNNGIRNKALVLKENL